MPNLSLLNAAFSAIFAGLPSNDIHKLFEASYAMAPQPALMAPKSHDQSLDILAEWMPCDKWTFLDSSGLDPQYDYDFTSVKDDGKKYMRGGHQYHRPYGWNRIALKVHGKYSGGDEWLGPNGIRTEEAPNEWAVSYHGTKAEHAVNIIKQGLKTGPRERFGPGIYSSPSPKMVEERYAQEFRYEGKVYKIAFQNRVNPDSVQIIPASATKAGAEYWISQEGDIRPYAVILKLATVENDCNIF